MGRRVLGIRYLVLGEGSLLGGVVPSEESPLALVPRPFSPDSVEGEDRRCV